MLSLLSTSLNPSLHTHRTYVVSSGDNFSALKAAEFEREIEQKYAPAVAAAGVGVSNSRSMSKQSDGVQRGYDIRWVPRARRIHQSLLTTPGSACMCLWACFGVLRGDRHRLRPDDSAVAAASPSSSSAAEWTYGKESRAWEERYQYPDLIIANGPGTAVLIILASLVLRFFACKGTEGKMRSIYIESWARVKKLSLSGRILRTAGMVNRFMVQWEGLARNGAEFRGVLVH
ncbi:MAG: hypothetical protein Q9167_005606 [Letrouitia subvulpina]